MAEVLIKNLIVVYCYECGEPIFVGSYLTDYFFGPFINVCEDCGYRYYPNSIKESD